MAKKILLSVAAVLAVSVVAVCVLASRQPDEMRVARSISIDAPAGKIFPYANDLTRWQDWSPWAHLDPAMKIAISEPATGKGAFYTWKGNRDVGAGRMEIVESAAPSKVVYALEFTEPFKAKNDVSIELAKNGAKTDVTWTMSGPMPFVSKIMCVFMDMDAMLGKDFERGLAQLKAKAETVRLSAKR